MGRCSNNLCISRTSFGVHGKKKPAEVCQKHAEAGMINAFSKRFSHESCMATSFSREARRGRYVHGTPQGFCFDHSCSKKYFFNVEGRKTPAHCENTPRKASYKRCLHHTCTMTSKFDVRGSDTAVDEDGIVDIRIKGWSHGYCTN